ncbi:MAG: hypothetical protein RMK73_07715 [Geminicoccaceae bacterium]|nr:hypothetical protein [Geminicoccaceae bacterium]MCS7267857.1 hypothetical protein [Geminicoccaceae bacterium]MDW8124520.1 hypothetical protein [Geminicoccaceae bacterium]MDW8341352.1 hypothetical protein [Geminicoccaceae bacterium]
MGRNRRRFLAEGAALAVGFATGRADAAELFVRVVNRSEPTACAEKDNVTIELISGAVRRFEVEAVHPAYIGTLNVDRWLPDLTNCEQVVSTAPEYSFHPARKTIYETVEWQLVGYVFAKFWRPTLVPFRVGDTVHGGFHVLQLWTRFQERAEEILVVYPGDGYWRARPLPPAHLRWTAYGTSFLVGPVETRGRPMVDVSAMAFVPETKTFTFDFARGGHGTLRLAHLDQERITLEVAFDRPIGDDRPFAALRSMYVTEFNADVARIAWRVPAGHFEEAPLPAFREALASELWAGRIVPSRHNTSAPDMILRRFAP